MSFQASADEAALHVLSERLDAIQSMSADFKQVLRDETGELLQTSQGMMAWQRPDRFYWSIVSPDQQTLIADGQYLWQYTPSLKQAVRRPQIQGDGTPAALLSGSVDALAKQFLVRRSRVGRSEQFELMPKPGMSQTGASAAYRRIVLCFESGSLVQMIFDDQLDQHTTFDLSHIKQNIALPKGLFVLRLPPSVALEIQEGQG